MNDEADTTTTTTTKASDCRCRTFASRRGFPLLGLGAKRHPDLYAMFLKNPDRTVVDIYSGRELAVAADEINRGLLTAFNQWTTDDWLQKHTAVSAEDFAREPHRNRFAVVVARNAHMAYHFGQAILTRPRKA